MLIITSISQKTNYEAISSSEINNQKISSSKSTLDILNDKIQKYEKAEFKKLLNLSSNIEQSQKEESNAKLTNRSSSVCSTNSQFRNPVVQKISDTLKLKFNKEIILPQNTQYKQNPLKDSNISCSLQPIQEQIEDMMTAQSQADMHIDDSKCEKQWQQIQGNFECGERLLTLNEQSTFKVNFNQDVQFIREEPLIKDNTKEYGCINFYDSKQQDQEVDQIIKKSIILKSFHQKSQIECLSQESSTSSYLQNPDKPSESVRNITQIVENTNNFMQILDLFTYDNQKELQLYSTQPINNEQSKSQLYNYLDNRSSLIDQDQHHNDNCMKTIQTFTDDFVEDKGKSESNPQFKNSKKTVGIRVDELLNKFKKESNFDTMSKSKSKKKQIINIINNQSTGPQTINVQNEKEIEVLKFESNKAQEIINKNEKGQECEIEMKTWIQQKYDSQGSPLPLKLPLQEYQFDKKEINNFVSKSDRFAIQQLGSSENIHFYQQSLNHQSKNLNLNHLKLKNQNKEKEQININSEREKRKSSLIKYNQQQVKNQQKKYDKQQFQKFQILNQCVLGQSSKQLVKKPFKKTGIKISQNENKKENTISINDKQRKVQANFILNQGKKQNSNNQKQNYLKEQKMEQFINSTNMVNNTQTLQKEFLDCQKDLEEMKYNEISPQKYQESQRNQIISLLSGNSREGDIINLPFQFMQTITLSQGQGQGGSTQISSERQFANEHNLIHSNLQTSFLQTVQIQKDVFQNQQENIQETILQSHRNIDINFQEINFKNDQNSARNQQLSSRIEDKIRMIEEQNRQLQLYINQNNITHESKNLSIQIDDSDERKKIIENIGTQPITATNVLLSSDINKKKFCFDYEDLNKQDEQIQNDFEEQLNLLSSQRLSYEIGYFEASSSYLNTQNFRTPRVIQMLSDRSNEGYLPDYGNEGLLSNMINDQSPLQIDYSNNSYQQNIIENINKNAYQSKESNISSNASLHQKQQIIKIYDYQQNQQNKITVSPKKNAYRVNPSLINKNDINKPIQQSNSIMSGVEESENLKQLSSNLQESQFTALEQNKMHQFSQKQLNPFKSDQQVEIKKILENIENLKRARANSGDRRSSQELKILTEQVIEKSLLQIQQIQGGGNKNI